MLQTGSESQPSSTQVIPGDPTKSYPIVQETLALEPSSVLSVCRTTCPLAGVGSPQSETKELQIRLYI